MTSHSLSNRMTRAIKLDVHLFEEVEADSGATGQALLAVIAVSVATGIGAGLASLGRGGGAPFFLALAGGVVSSIAGWLAWSFLTYFIGTRIFKGPATSATWGELLRAIGFSTSPGVFRIFFFIPIVGGIISLVASVWSLIAGVIAVRQALDFSTGRAVLTVAAGFIAYLLIIGVMFTLVGIGAGGVPAF